MGIRSFESRLERMVEGTFARVFRSGVGPVEIARRMVRAMDDGRTVGVSGEVVAPNHFVVTLPADDVDRFGEVEGSLRRELGEAAREHARDNRYHFMGPVGVELVPAEGRVAGGFDVAAQFREGSGANAGSLLLPTGDRVPLADAVILLGRMPDCTVVLADPNVSRHHAEVRPTATGYQLVDLGSTNGTRVNRAKVGTHLLVDGDEITLGNTLIRFEAS